MMPVYQQFCLNVAAHGGDADSAKLRIYHFPTQERAEQVLRKRGLRLPSKRVRFLI
jgi:hypothetical protein